MSLALTRSSGGLTGGGSGGNIGEVRCGRLRTASRGRSAWRPESSTFAVDIGQPGRSGAGATRRGSWDPPGEDVKKGASALITTSRRESHADAPGPDLTAVADGAAGGLPAVFYRSVVSCLLRADGRVCGAAGTADRVRHADRCGIVAAVVSSPGAPVLLPRPVEQRRPRPRAGAPGGDPACP